MLAMVKPRPAHVDGSRKRAFKKFIVDPLETKSPRSVGAARAGQQQPCGLLAGALLVAVHDHADAGIEAGRQWDDSRP